MADTQGAFYYTKDEIEEMFPGGDGRFMKKADYDSNNSGTVDNAKKVNGKTVESDVPANAKFTDTTYTAGYGISILNGVISCTIGG